MNKTTYRGRSSPERMRRAAKAVYLEVPESIAGDLSAMLPDAAGEIEELRAYIRSLQVGEE